MRPFGAVWLILLAVCALDSGGRAGESGSVSLFLPQAVGLPYHTLLASENHSAAPVPFALWGQQGGRTLKNPLFLRSQTVSVVTVYGDSTIPLPRPWWRGRMTDFYPTTRLLVGF